MIHCVFAIYDTAAQAHVHLFVQPTKGVALRQFSDMANDSQSKLSQHAADYVLFELGTYDDVKGSILMHDAKINLGCAIEFKKADVKV